MKKIKNDTLFFMDIDESNLAIGCKDCFKEQQSHLEAIQRIAHIGIWRWSSDSNKLEWSIGMYKQYGVDNSFNLNMASFLEMVHPEDVKEVIKSFNYSMGTNNRFTLDFRIIDANGKLKHLRNEAEIEYDEEGIPSSLYGVSHDDTERVEALAEMEFMANHDPLTGLYNRAVFNNRLKELETKHQRSSDINYTVLCFIDMDDFKNINDTHGHDVGDKFLIEVGARLNRATRETDIVSRFGGDEFAIILSGVKSKDEASIVASKITEILKEPYEINDHKITSQASMGLSLYPMCSESISQLLKDADLALYKAKDDGKGCFRFYSDTL